MNETNISWVRWRDGTGWRKGYTWNPADGCTQVSPGCRNCYARAITERFPKNFPDGFSVTLHPERLEQILNKKKLPPGARVFVNSMSDMFHPGVPFDFIDHCFSLMSERRDVAFMILTKRPNRMLQYFEWSSFGGTYGGGDYDPNIMLGVSAENQFYADLRIPQLLKMPAWKKFVSCEPLLGPIDLSKYLGKGLILPGGWSYRQTIQGCFAAVKDRDLPDWPVDGLDLVIAGGESGAGHRPMDPDWARGIRDQCIAHSAPFFYKQGGGARPGTDSILDGREWKEFPEMDLELQAEGSN